MEEHKDIASNQEQMFNEVATIIQQHRVSASHAINNETLLTAWHVGAYVSGKIRNEGWGNKVVTQLSEFIRSKQPDVKGYSCRNIYNMVMFFDEYSSERFNNVQLAYLPKGIVQTPSAQLDKNTNIPPINTEEIQNNCEKTNNHAIVQSLTAKLHDYTDINAYAPIPPILRLTTFTNHSIILNKCSDMEHRLFYIIHAHKERLTARELTRCISNQTYESLLGNKKNLSKGLLDAYPPAPYMFKDTVFVDFLNLPKKHSESKLKKGLLTHMKEFILELGKDFLFMDQEYSLNVGGSTFKADLLFFHRGLQALVAVELKKTKFHPRDLGQLEFYLEALDRDVKRSNENPSVGIILCPEADQTVVEYAMSRSMSPAMVAEYKRLLIPKERLVEQLRQYCAYLPDSALE